MDEEKTADKVYKNNNKSLALRSRRAFCLFPTVVTRGAMSRDEQAEA